MIPKTFSWYADWFIELFLNFLCVLIDLLFFQIFSSGSVWFKCSVAVPKELQSPTRTWLLREQCSPRTEEAARCPPWQLTAPFLRGILEMNTEANNLWLYWQLQKTKCVPCRVGDGTVNAMLQCISVLRSPNTKICCHWGHYGPVDISFWDPRFLSVCKSFLALRVQSNSQHQGASLPPLHLSSQSTTNLQQVVAPHCCVSLPPILKSLFLLKSHPHCLNWAADSRINY